MEFILKEFLERIHLNGLIVMRRT